MSSSSISGGFLNRLVEDGQISLGRKTDCLKTLEKVIGNLADNEKSRDPKYRRLRLKNEKLHERIFSIPYMVDLLEVALGFEKQQESGEVFLVLMGDTANCQICHQEILAVQERLSASATNNHNSRAPYVEKLSEKQKARRLLEEKKHLEKLKAEENRKRNLALLRQDKRARQDPNWKAKASAAATKTGTGISTFRDKFGEDQGGC